MDVRKRKNKKSTDKNPTLLVYDTLFNFMMYMEIESALDFD